MNDIRNPVKYVQVHRSSIRMDMITIFSNPEILNFVIQVRVIDERGRYEKTEGKGVVLDMITNIWQDCFISLIVGSSEKIPFIRSTTFQKESGKQ